MAGDLNFTVDFQSEAAKRQIDDLWSRFKNGSQEAGDSLNRLLGGTIEKKVKVTLQRDDTGVKQLKTDVVTVRSELDKLTKAYASATKVQPFSVTNLRQAINEAKQARDSISRFGAEVDLLNKKQLFGATQTAAFSTASDKVKTLESQLKNLELAGSSAFTRLSSALGIDKFLAFGQGLQNVVTIFQSLGIAVAAVTAPVRAVTNALSNLQSFGLSFQAIGLGASSISTALNETKRISLGLGVSLDTVRNGFQQLSPVIINSGGTLKDVSAITESLSSRFAVFGLSADQSRRVMNGVIQAFAKGKLQAEELTQQISEADPAFKTDFANALFKAKGSLKDFSQEFDGSVKGLEELVKAGKITSDVLIKVIPLLSKSSIIYGKLGDSAVSAVNALGQSGVTIKQVESNLQSLNQLSLERVARFADPLIKALLLVQAQVVDFLTALSKLQATKDLISIFTNIAQSVAGVVDFFLKGIQGILVVIAPITSLISTLSKIPGVIELIGIALISRLLKPVKAATGAVADLGKQLINIDPGPSKKIDLIDTSATKKKLDALKKDLNIQTGPLKVDTNSVNLGDLTKRQQKAVLKQRKIQKELSDSLQALQDKYKQTSQNIAAIEGAPAREANRLSRIRGIQDEIKSLENLKKAAQNEAKVLRDSGSRLLKVPAQTPEEQSIKAANINQFKSVYAQKVKVIDDYSREIALKQKELSGISLSPKIETRPEFTTDLSSLKAEQVRVKAEIIRTYKQLESASSILIARPKKTNVENVDGLIEYDKSAQNARKYADEVIKANAAVAASKDPVIQANELEIQSLQKREAALRKTLDAQRKSNAPLSESSATRTEYEAVTAELERRQKVLAADKVQIEQNTKSYFSYEKTLEAVTNGTDLSKKSLVDLSRGAELARGTLNSLSGKYESLVNQNQSLSQEIGKTKASIAGFSFGSAEADLAKQKLAALEDQYNKNVGAIGQIGGASRIVAADLDELEQASIKVANANTFVGRTSKYFDDLSNSSNRWVAGFGTAVPKIAKSIKDTFNSIKSTIASFGGELLVFAALAVATAAWNKATEQTTKIQEESKAKVESLTQTAKELDDTLKQLTGGSSAAADLDKVIPKVSALDSVLLNLGNVLIKVGDIFTNTFEAIGKSISSSTGKVPTATEKFNGLAAALLLVGAAAGVGFLVGGPAGAVAGTVVGIAVAATAAFGGEAAAIEEINKASVERRKAITAEVIASKDLIGKVDLLGQAYNRYKASREKTGSTAASSGEALSLAKLQSGYAKLVETQDGLKSEISTNQSIVKGLKAQTAETDKLIAKKKEQIASIKNEIRRKPQNGSEAINQARPNIQRTEKLAKLNDEIGALTSQNNVAKAASKAYSEEIIKQQAEARILAEQIEVLRQKYGLLSPEQLKTATNLDNLNKKLAETEAGLKFIDFDTQRAKFEALAQSAGVFKAQIERLENAAADQKLKGYIAELSRQLASGEIPNNLANIGNLVKSLEQRTLNIDINSPELPQVIQQLLEAKDVEDKLQNRKATITIELITKGLENGSLAGTLRQYDELITQLNQKKITTPVDSSGYNTLLEQIKNIGQARQQLEQTTSDLEERKYNIQKERIDIIANLEKARADLRISQIDREIEAINRLYDSQIGALEKQKGPAEQQLAQVQRQELEAKAQKGGREGLEARAQLERQDREEKIARLREEKAAKLKELEDQKLKLGEEAAKREIEVAKQRLAIEEKIATIRLKALAGEEASIDKVLASRSNAQSEGAANLGRQDGEAYNKAFASAIVGGSLESFRNLPDAKVKFNVDDAAVKASYKDLLIANDNYATKLEEVNALQKQFNELPIGPTDTRSLELINQYVQSDKELLDLGVRKQAAEEQFYNKLRETSTVLGEVKISQSELTQELARASQLPGPIDPAKVQQAKADVEQLTGALNSQQTVVNSLAESYKAQQDPERAQAALQSLDQEKAKLSDISTELQGAKLYYDDIAAAASNVSQVDITPQGLGSLADSTSNIKSGFDGITESVNKISSGTEVASGNLKAITITTNESATAAEGANESFSKAGESVRTGLLQALNEVPAKLDSIRSQMAEIFAKDYTINVTLNVSKQGLWTGGPVSKGTAYTVNELGQEGFMNSFGRVTPIQKQSYGTWRAPSDGLVIPADIYAQMKQNAVQAPVGRVQHSAKNVKTVKSSNGGGNISGLIAAFMHKIDAKNNNNNDLGQMAQVQAHQALEIGKLSRAIQDLTEKDWNVRVGVKSSDSATYLKTLNYRM